MPQGYKRAPHYRKQKFKRSSYARPVNSTIAYRNARLTNNPPRYGMPQQHIAKLRYSDRFPGTTPAFSVPQRFLFVANGMYDPDATGIGHQPRGFDELMAFYSHYTVSQAKITVVITTDLTKPIVCQILQVLDTTAIDTNGVDESTYAVESYINRQNGGNLPLSTTHNVGKFLGIPSLRSYAAARGSKVANPTEKTYFQVTVFNPNVSDSELLTYQMKVTIDFTAMFGEPQQPAQS